MVIISWVIELEVSFLIIAHETKFITKMTKKTKKNFLRIMSILIYSLPEKSKSASNFVLNQTKKHDKMIRNKSNIKI